MSNHSLSAQQQTCILRLYLTDLSVTAAGLNQPAPTAVPLIKNKAEKQEGDFPVVFLTMVMSTEVRINLQRFAAVTAPLISPCSGSSTLLKRAKTKAYDCGFRLRNSVKKPWWLSCQISISFTNQVNFLHILSGFITLPQARVVQQLTQTPRHKALWSFCIDLLRPFTQKQHENKYLCIDNKDGEWYLYQFLCLNSCMLNDTKYIKRKTNGSGVGKTLLASLPLQSFNFQSCTSHR